MSIAYFLLIECSTVANITTANNTSEEKFDFSTTSAQVVIETELDYEGTTGYYFLMSVEDTGSTPKLTGYIAVRVRYRKVSKFLDARKFSVIHLKFKQRDQT